MSLSSRPLIGVIADVRPVDGQNFHMGQEKYLSALWQAAGVMPIVIPSFGDRLNLGELVDGLDGLLLTGCISNIEPWRYGGPSDPPSDPYDPARDETTLPLVEIALSRALPTLAVCRGFQELNVALGGTLLPRVHEVPGRLDHRAPYGRPLDEQYAPAHPVTITPGGKLARLYPNEPEIRVNSLHWQGIDRLAPRLAIEAKAPDGTIEAVSVIDAPGFVLGVQWHPEWQVMTNPVSVAIFGAFGEAAAARKRARG